MNFKYIWDMYVQSEEGKSAIRKFADIRDIFAKFGGIYLSTDGSEAGNKAAISRFNEYFKTVESSDQLSDWKERVLDYANNVGFEVKNIKESLQYVGEIKSFENAEKFYLDLQDRLDCDKDDEELISEVTVGVAEDIFTK